MTTNLGSGPLHACPSCGTEHRCLTDLCAICRDDGDLAYEGGWYVRGSVRYPCYPERRSA